MVSSENRIFLHFADHLMDHLSGANIFSIFHTIGSARGFYSFLAPYFVAFSQFAMMRQLNHTLFEKLDLANNGIAREKIHIMPPIFNVHRLQPVLNAV